MIDILIRILAESLHILLESAPYVLLGLLAAGLLQAFLPVSLISRHLGGRSGASVMKAALFGVPMPLCSCGVVPAATGLRKSGASRGATVSFLISTPETGVDSIAITYALLDPVMTVLRPIAAFFTATSAGLLVNRLPAPESSEGPKSIEPPTPAAAGGG
jgi:uncharacterized membrane protein YraQ (UPF0718 family)